MRARIPAAVALAATGAVIPALPAGAATLTVCPSGCPYSTIQSAVDAAAAGDVVSVGPSTYAEHVTIAKSSTLAGAGAASTVVDGGGSGVVLDITHAPVATVRGLRVAHGTIGVHIANYFSGDHATVSLIDVVVTGNVSDPAVMAGVGIYNTGGHVSLERTTVTGNVGDFGSGIFNGPGTMTVRRSAVRDNHGTGSGGGIFNDEAELTLTDTTVTGNTTADGGGLFTIEGTVTIDASRLTRYSASDNGGGFAAVEAVAHISRTLIRDNRAGVLGGGLSNYAGGLSGVVLSVERTDIASNSAWRGGGISNDNVAPSTLALVHTRVDHNLPNDCVGLAC